MRGNPPERPWAAGPQGTGRPHGRPAAQHRSGPPERVRSALRAASASCPSTAIRQRRSMFASPSSDRMMAGPGQ